MFPEILKNKIILIVALIFFLNSLTLAAIIPILYIYARQFALTDFEIGLLFGSFALAQFGQN